MKRLPLAVLTVLVLAIVAAGAVWRLGSPSSQSAAVPVTADTALTADSPPAPPSDELDGHFSLTDQNGMRRTDADFHGKYVLLFFGYTYCPDVCPTTLAIEAEALDKIGSRASLVAPIFISVDPQRDTPDRLKSYLAAFDAKEPSPRLKFVGLTGSEDEIAKAADSYRVYYRAHLDALHSNGADYSIDHTANVLLMSPEGKFVAYYTPGVLPDEMAADLMKTLSPG
jgi:protein SCO1